MAFVNILVLLACLCFSSADQPYEDGMLKSKLLRGQVPDFQQKYRSSYGQSNSSSSGKGKLGAFGAGCVLWGLIPCCICQNERIAIKQAKLQGKASRGSVIVEDAKREPIPQLEGHIVYVTGMSECKDELKDKVFTSVTTTNCVKLRRVVEMRQWVETEIEEENDGRKTVRYTYEMEWRDTQQRTPHDSNGQHSNTNMPITSTQRTTDGDRLGAEIADGEGEACPEAKAAAVKLGAYYCGDFVRREMKNWIPVVLTEEKLKAPSRTPLASNYSAATKFDNVWWHFKLTAAQQDGQSDLGTVRVRFEELKCGPLSVCGVLAHTDPGWTFVPVLREDGSVSETCLDEFGLSSCPCFSAKNPKFKELATGDDQTVVDQMLKDYLTNLAERELKKTEMDQFRLLKAEDEKTQTFYKADDGDPLVNMMHKLGIEEEFLGVKEQEVTPVEMMKEEAANAFKRHCIVRVCGVFLGVMASLLILSPFTNWLTSSWLIYLLGGGLLSCILQLTACLCSVTVVTLIIAVAWMRHRWRLSLFMFILIAGAFAGMHTLAMDREGTCGTFSHPPASGVCQQGFVPMDASTVCMSVPCSPTDCCRQSGAGALLL